MGKSIKIYKPRPGDNITDAAVDVVLLANNPPVRRRGGG